MEAEKLEHKIAILTRLAEISAVLNSTLELEPLLEFLMDSAAQITDSDAASVLLWDFNQRELRIAATTTSSADLKLIGQAVPLESIAGTVMQVQRPIQVEDAHDDPRHYRKLDTDKGFSTELILGVPLKVKNRAIGVLEVLNKRHLPWTTEDEDYLSILADQAAVAIELAQLVTALQKANNELSELDKLKSDFIAIASHELRTPLSVILGYASFLKQTSDGEVSEHATKVMDSALQLRRIIEDMISLSYLKEGAADIVADQVPMRELIDEALEEIESLCEAKGHRVVVEGPVDNITLYIDSVRIGKALNNILNNAVRFTPDGGCITIKAEPRDRSEAWITVTDDGIGLTEEQLGLVFTEFYQAEDHMTRQHGGLGIGLSIARALVAAHGGRLWAASEGLGKGAAFTMALPLAEAADSR